MHASTESVQTPHSCYRQYSVYIRLYITYAQHVFTLVTYTLYCSVTNV